MPDDTNYKELALFQHVMRWSCCVHDSCRGATTGLADADNDHASGEYEFKRGTVKLVRLHDFMVGRGMWARLPG